MSEEELKNRTMEIRCPACASEHKQKIANVVVLGNATYKASKQIDKDAFSSVQFKCSKCKTIIYLNIYKV